MWKAILLDLDGTTIPNTQVGRPSAKVMSSILNARSKCIVSVVTGRPYFICKDLLHELNICSPSVIDGGAQIINPPDGDILFEKQLTEELVRKVLNTLQDFSYDIVSSEPDSPPLSVDLPITKTGKLCPFRASQEDKSKILSRLSKIPEISAHPVTSWKKEAFDIHITHSEATKKHAVEHLLEILQIDKKDAIGVGDGNNDIPLFESVGFKVAMGNATEDLKLLADFVCPSVDDDGVAHVIEKFILV